MYTTIKYDDGSYYRGSVNERGQIHGEGTLYWPNNNRFEGKWDSGYFLSGTYYCNDGYKYKGKVAYKYDLELTGEGISYFTNGDIYVGYHSEGDPSCKGTMYYNDGGIEKGFWVNGKLSSGELITSIGNVLKGDFYRNDKALTVVDGTLTYWYGESYKGKLIDYKFEGRGKYYNYKNILLYEGEYKNSLKDGYGIQYYMNGDTYEGEWKENLMDGQGILKAAGHTREGTWKKGLKDGQFIDIDYFNNTKTVSIYKEDKLVEEVSKSIYDKKRKNETIQYKNGALYVGEVKNNKANGIGILYPNANDKSQYYVGEFVNGKLNGKGFCNLKDYTYKGQFKKGKITGQGIMDHKDIIGGVAGIFKNGVPYGYCQFKDKIENISDIYGIYKGGKFKKDVYIKYKDNRVYFGGVSGFLPHGTGTMYYSNGSFIIGKFKKGEISKDAILIENNKKYEVAYEKGTCIKKREWILEIE